MKRTFDERQDTSSVPWPPLSPALDDADSFFKQYDYAAPPRKRQRPPSLCSAGASTTATFDSCLPDLHSNMNGMAPPPSTMAPSSMHITYGEHQGLPVAYHFRNGNDEIDRILEDARKGTLQPENPRAKAHIDQFERELRPMQKNHTLAFESRPRGSGPWAPIDPTSLHPSTISQGPGLVFPHQRNSSISHSLNRHYPHTQPTSLYIPDKAQTEYGFQRKDSGYGTNTFVSPHTKSVLSSHDLNNLSVFNEDLSYPQECQSMTTGLEGLDRQSLATDQPLWDPFNDDGSGPLDGFQNDHSSRSGFANLSVPDGPPWMCSYCEIQPFKNKSEFK